MGGDGFKGCCPPHPHPPPQGGGGKNATALRRSRSRLHTAARSDSLFSNWNTLVPQEKPHESHPPFAALGLAALLTAGAGAAEPAKAPADEGRRPLRSRRPHPPEKGRPRRRRLGCHRRPPTRWRRSRACAPQGRPAGPGRRSTPKVASLRRTMWRADRPVRRPRGAEDVPRTRDAPEVRPRLREVFRLRAGVWLHQSEEVKAAPADPMPCAPRESARRASRLRISMPRSSVRSSAA